VEDIVKFFIRTGYTRFAGYLAGGMKAWDYAGLPLEKVGQMTVHELAHSGERLQLLDVRTPGEWGEGHVPRARHIFLPELFERAGELDAERPTAVYCDSGYRASIGTSILKQKGFKRVCNVPGSWQAWKNAALPVAGGNGE
jgi:hydroxyacylglutathione hydrolase